MRLKLYELIIKTFVYFFVKIASKKRGVSRVRATEAMASKLIRTQKLRDLK
jgi:hypothetical protein